VQLLDKGDRPKIGGIVIEKSNNNTVTVKGSTNCFFVDNVTEKVALQELNEIKELYLKLINSSPDFKEYVTNKALVLELYLETGKSGFLVCSLINDKLVWANKL